MVIRLPRTRARALMAIACVALSLAFGANAAEEPVAETPQQDSLGAGIRIAGIAIAVALCIGITGIATAKVQASVGAGGTGVLAEKPDMLAYVLILYAIPETIVVLGFVIAILILRLAG